VGLVRGSPLTPSEIIKTYIGTESRFYFLF
jgi:hypothetical protein